MNHCARVLPHPFTQCSTILLSTTLKYLERMACSVVSPSLPSDFTAMLPTKLICPVSRNSTLFITKGANLKLWYLFPNYFFDSGGSTVDWTQRFYLHLYLQPFIFLFYFETSHYIKLPRLALKLWYSCPASWVSMMIGVYHCIQPELFPPRF